MGFLVELEDREELAEAKTVVTATGTSFRKTENGWVGETNFLVELDTSEEEV